MRARFLVHCAYYQWLMDRDSFDSEQEEIRAQNGDHLLQRFERAFRPGVPGGYRQSGARRGVAHPHEEGPGNDGP